MLLQIVAVRDSASDAFMIPHFVASVNAGLRGFSDGVNSPESKDWFNHPADFVLYHLGTFDDSSGTFHALPTPEQVARAIDLKKSTE